MGQDSQQELKDLAVVHRFYQLLLEKSLGHPIPVPGEVAQAQEAGSDPGALRVLKNWLSLLDLAIAPPMLRDFLKSSQGLDTAIALLRYFVGKASDHTADRDKTDCITTYLFRHPPANLPIPWERPETTESFYFLSQAALAFETYIYGSLSHVQFDSMPAQHVQLLREFEYIHQEMEELRHFDQVTDSGIVVRVRELKHSLGKSFYHPDSLANIAVWNDVFGRRFDDLFHEAATQIKVFAETVQKEGASIMTRIEGDITVKQMSELETGQILMEDYRHAQDQLKKVSRYKKAVDNKRTGRIYTRGPVEQTATALARTLSPHQLTQPTQAASAPGPVLASRPDIPPQLGPTIPLAVSPSQAVQNAIQEGKVHSTREAIRNHVMQADPKIAHVANIKNTKIVLTPAEMEAFRADYQGEKSYRADYANAMMTIVAYLARMTAEVDEYNQKSKSAYLWKPHADALSYLLHSLERLSQQIDRVKAVAQARGLGDKAAALDASFQRLKEYSKTAAFALQDASN